MFRCLSMKRTADSKTESKLDTGLEPTSPKFTDYSINKFKPNYNGKKKVSGKIIDSGIKGLKLNCIKSTGNKYFIQQFWFNGKADLWTVGEFRLGIFGIKECRTKAVEIMKTHTDDNGMWIKNPKITAKYRRERIKKAELQKRQMLTIRQCIERLCEANFPKARTDGTVTAKSAVRMCLYLIGYNKRTQHLLFDDDEFGNGFIKFKANKSYNTNEPESWTDLFSKFPPGHGLIKKGNLKNPKGELSLYDSEDSKLLIEELTPGIIKHYLNSKADRSYGTKEAIRDAFVILWSYSKQFMGTDIPRNPTDREVLEIKKPGISKSPNSKYNRKKFEGYELSKFFIALQSLSIKHPFQAEAIMLMMFSGRRTEELLKIRKQNVFKKGEKDNPFGKDMIIFLPASITKNRKDSFITITPPVTFVLNQLENLYKRDELMKYKFVPHLFPTIKTNPQKWFTDDDIASKKYLQSKATRLKQIRECWRTMIEETGISGVPRMMRKSYSSNTVLVLKSTNEAIQLTGHSKTATLDLFYDIHNTDQITEYANKVSAEVFGFVKQ